MTKSWLTDPLPPQQERMRLFYAGAKPCYANHLAGHDTLVSYFEEQQLRIVDDMIAGAANPPGAVIIDCGAYSAWKQAYKPEVKPIDLDAYIPYCLRAVEGLGRGLVAVVALDVIPGRWVDKGTFIPPSPEEAHRAVWDTIHNTMAMVRAGVPKHKLMPVFHFGDPPWVLEFYERVGFELIGLSGASIQGKPEMEEWVDEMLACYPEQRFHLLGVTAKWAFTKHAWSLDSTSWFNFQRFGFKKNRHLLYGLRDKFFARWPRTKEILDDISDEGRDLNAGLCREIGKDSLADRLGASNQDRFHEAFQVGWPELSRALGSYVDFGMFEGDDEADMKAAWQLAQNYLADKYHNGEWVEPRWLVMLDIIEIEDVPAYLQRWNMEDAA